MIILIGGFGSVGKTKLAHDLMIDNNIPYFSIDHLMMGIYRSNKNCGFNPESEAAVIIHKIWPIVLEMVKTNIENNHSMIFEGFQINPTNVAKIENEYRSKIIPVFLAFSSDYIKMSYDEIKRNRSAIEKRMDIDETEIMIERNTELLNECKENAIEPYIIKNNYTDEIEVIRNEINLTIAST
jgi:putative acetyltransferase